jgi:hypothetical protein
MPTRRPTKSAAKKPHAKATPKRKNGKSRAK